MTTEPLTVLIADDHVLFRKGLHALLSSLPDVVVVGEASTGADVVSAAKDLQPDVVLMDLQMPEGGGLEATRRIALECPHVRVLVVTMFRDDDSVFTALRAGARGYVLKDADEDEMVRALRAVGRGEAIFSPAIATRVLAFFSAPHPSVPREAFPMLTDREREILRYLTEGLTNAMISRKLDLRGKTVSNYVSSIFGKLQVADRAEAIARAKEAGLGRE